MYMGRNREYKDWSHIPNGRRRYMAEILPIRGKTLSNQSLNQIQGQLY